MSRESIIVSPNPRGVFLPVIVTGTPKPGTMMEITPATEPVNGIYTARVYQPGTDGKRRPLMILIEDQESGKRVTDAYVTGTLGKIYIPAPGEWLQVLLADVSGTGDAHAIGERLIADTGTGKFIATTGSPEVEPFIVMETVAAPTADTLALVMCNS